MNTGLYYSDDCSCMSVDRIAPKKRVVLVTGGTGFVGSALKDVVGDGKWSHSEDEFHFVGRADADLRDVNEAEKLFASVRPTHVIHLAAMTGGLYKNMAYEVDFFRDNVAINDSVLYCAHKANVCKVISCLSTCIFPDKTAYPIDESMLHAGKPHDSNLGYAMAKRMIDTLNHCYANQYNCNFTAVIPTNIYGPHDNFDIENGHVIPGLIQKCSLAKEKNEDFVVWGSGKPLRQFIFSEDLAKLLLWALKEYDSVEPIIFSVDATSEVSIESVARMIASKFQFSGKIVTDTSKSDGQYKKTASNAKLRLLLPDFEFTSLDKGLTKTIDWYEHSKLSKNNNKREID
uniref:GDP-L-fucose synthase n=1 Tax=Albugo laibachii Nc14 TaxID=890382 RepID=F0WEG3_9STRA|nr:GDPLfucose synthetase putative [Albugo laibachii Nc14]|eukprot:CCA19595.1 GDPLfucose synthetase putative [Albugo laibachii Nc14]